MPLDPQAASWREGWLVWEKSLEAGNALDSEMMNRLLEIPNGHGVSEIRKSTANANRSWARYVSIVSAALVVSLILAIGMSKFSPVIDPPKDTDTDLFGNPLVNRTVTPPNGRDIFAWDDGLDGRMMRMEARLTMAQYDSASLGDSYDSIRSQLDSLSREIEQNSM